MDKNELLLELKKCKSVDEILKFAKRLNQKITKEEATQYFNKYCKTSDGMLNEEELNNVSGGSSSCNNFSAPPENRYDYYDYPTKEAVVFIFNVGDEVSFYKRMLDVRDEGYVFNGKVESRKAVQVGRNRWQDAYRVSYIDQCGKSCIETEVFRGAIVKK